MAIKYPKDIRLLENRGHVRYMHIVYQSGEVFEDAGHASVASERIKVQKNHQRVIPALLLARAILGLHMSFDGI